MNISKEQPIPEDSLEEDQDEFPEEDGHTSPWADEALLEYSIKGLNSINILD